MLRVVSGIPNCPGRIGADISEFVEIGKLHHSQPPESTKARNEVRTSERWQVLRLEREISLLPGRCLEPRHMPHRAAYRLLSEPRAGTQDNLEPRQEALACRLCNLQYWWCGGGDADLQRSQADREPGFIRRRWHRLHRADRPIRRGRLPFKSGIGP